MENFNQVSAQSYNFGQEVENNVNAQKFLKKIEKIIKPPVGQIVYRYIDRERELALRSNHSVRIYKACMNAQGYPCSLPFNPTPTPGSHPTPLPRLLELQP